MRNLFSLFRSMSQWFRPIRRARTGQSPGNPSRASEQANQALSPEKFREMFAAMLTDPETPKAITRSLFPYFAVQGGTCTLADNIQAGDFGKNCTSGDFTFSNSRVGIGTTNPQDALDITGPTNASVFLHGPGTHQYAISGAT